MLGCKLKVWLSGKLDSAIHKLKWDVLVEAGCVCKCASFSSGSSAVLLEGKVGQEGVKW